MFCIQHAYDNELKYFECIYGLYSTDMAICACWATEVHKLSESLIVWNIRFQL